ncbi:MAG: (d)CMP kinase [Clostridia bacterium]|nr:(d)CMP kinase [Clostridia bacterium]MBQ9781521.1 (d)CMP kinase [Clostridia bacterium]
MDHIQVAIDGPSGAGKSTVSKAIAKALGIIYVDTGALYRTVGYYAREQGIAVDNAADVVPYLPEISIEVRYENGVQCVYLNGENLGDRIRQNEISMYASAVSAVPEVRAFLLDTQKKIAAENSVIMDGRDIGTVILPDAHVKVFLTASNEARARRRYKELMEKGMPASYEEILSDMNRRDEADRTRAVAPAVPAADAVIFDNSDLDFDASVAELLCLIQKIATEKGIALS